MSPTLQLLLAIAIILFAAKVAGLVATRLRQPAVLGELLVGLLLGPSFLNLLNLPPFAGGTTQETIFDLAELGVIFLMFMAGLEVDLKELLGSGRVSLLAGVMGVIFPLIIGVGLGLLFNLPPLNALFIGLILTATSVSISAQTLLELGVLKSKEGLALLGAAVVDDVLVILVLSIFLALTVDSGGGEAGSGIVQIMLVVLRMGLYGAVAVLIGYRLFTPMTKRIEKLPISEGLIAFVLMITLVYAWAAEVIGEVAAITGAFIAGLFFARTPMHKEIERGMHTITYALFVPIFLVSIGLHANLQSLDANGFVFLIGLTAVAVISKIIGSGLGARLSGFDYVSSLRVGMGMVSRGEVGLIVTTIGLDVGIVSAQQYSQVVLMVLLTTLLTPLLLRWAFSLKHPAPRVTPVQETPQE